ncbi:MAG: TAT-variant-translocated molybdopterin oxidoreductase [Polyangiaceae bacterium]|nr:TAT-variant-translocated molybdopterin oxidoreductase [Polyangiaceae bacterium]
MKRVLPITRESGPPQHWRGPEHLAQTPAAREAAGREFPPGASVLEGADRRTFLGLLAASAAAASVSGCIRRPEEKIVPYTRSPEGIIPGVPQFYATTYAVQGEGHPLVVECHEGRPTKVEGNPEHPAARGGTLPWTQAAVLDLYDPDRATGATKGGAAAPQAAVLAELEARLKGAEAGGGDKLRLLSPRSSSPSFVRLKAAVLKRFPRAKFYEYEPAGDAEAVAGAELAFGRPLRPLVAYDRARVIVAADSDFLHTERGAVRANKLFSAGRRVRAPNDPMNRLYVAEPGFTVTGMGADHRLRLPAAAVEDFLLALAAELGRAGVALGPLAGKAKPSADLDGRWVAAAAKDLARQRNASIVLVGERQPAAVHALGYALNHALGNVGRTLQFLPAQPASPLADVKALAGEMAAGAVETLLVLGGNPVYDAPADLDFARALAKVPFRLHLASHVDETGAACTHTLPLAHDFEAWGDHLAADGTLAVQQPLIAPLFEGKTDVELLALVANARERRGYDVVRATFKDALGSVADDHGAPDAHADTHGARGAAPAGSADARVTPAGSAAPGASIAPSGSSAPAASASGPRPLPGSPPPFFAAASGSSPGRLVAPPASASGANSAMGAAVMAAGSASPAAATAGVGSAVAAQAPGAAPVAAASPTQVPGAPYGSITTALTGFERAWRRVLHDGFLPRSAAAPVEAALNADAVAGAVGRRAGQRPSAQALELAFAPDAALYDGRFANNSWLQELPHPVTKICWDNAAWLSLKTAQELGVASGEVVKLTVEGRSVEVPAWVVPGTADHTVQLQLGRGRTKAGRVGNGQGFDVGPLRTTKGFGFAAGAKLEKTGNTYGIAVTQEHNVLEGRPIVREATLEAYRKEPEFAQKAVEHKPLVALWQEREYDGHKWGMVVDMTACTGCSACVIACQAENNIPTVGKEQVTRQREMHWLRIDRYFSGTVEDPTVSSQPMMCVHCENAPCENVCPVNATSHSPEGLNEMTYNRCIGTRYCANNCPYKVRRFNFLDFHGEVPETVKMVANPNVSVRVRGVMEKCTYCVQRINQAKISAKRERRPLRDGDVNSACAQACPSDAITFGDLNDPQSRVARANAARHGYRVLDELNTKPRTTFLALIRNPNPELA